MSFPRLVLEGNVLTQSITNISLEYENAAGVNPRPTTLTRLSYDVKRQLKNGNISGATPNQFPDVPYDQFRFIHRWVGFCDVDSASVSNGGDSQALQNLQLIQSCVVLRRGAGIPYNSVYHPFEGQDEGSLYSLQVDADEPGTEWVWLQFKSKSGEVTSEWITRDWIIESINISDNLNGTSRVTFTFQIATFWLSLQETLAAIYN